MDRDSLLHIMKMVKDGIVTPQEGVELVEALNGEETENQKKTRRRRSKLVIHVTPKNEKGEKVNVSIPLGMAKGFLKHFATLKGMDLDFDEMKESGFHVESDDEVVDIHVED